MTGGAMPHSARLAAQQMREADTNEHVDGCASLVARLDDDPTDPRAPGVVLERFSLASDDARVPPGCCADPR